MSLIEQYHFESVQRRIRLGMAVRRAVKPTMKAIDPEPFYPQMWFFDLISPSAPPRATIPTVLNIRDAVCKYFNVLPIEVESSRRQGTLVYPRQMAFYLARNYTPYSYPQIARRFGDRDHTTIMYGSKKIARLVKEDWRVAYDVAHLEAML